MAEADGNAINFAGAWSPNQNIGHNEIMNSLMALKVKSGFT